MCICMKISCGVPSYSWPFWSILLHLRIQTVVLISGWKCLKKRIPFKIRNKTILFNNLYHLQCIMHYKLSRNDLKYMGDVHVSCANNKPFCLRDWGHFQIFWGSWKQGTPQACYTILTCQLKVHVNGREQKLSDEVIVESPEWAGSTLSLITFTLGSCRLKRNQKRERVGIRKESLALLEVTLCVEFLTMLQRRLLKI